MDPLKNTFTNFISSFISCFYKKSDVVVINTDCISGTKSVIDGYRTTWKPVYKNVYGFDWRWKLNSYYNPCTRKFETRSEYVYTPGFSWKNTSELVTEPKYKYVDVYNGTINNKYLLYLQKDEQHQVTEYMQMNFPVDSTFSLYKYFDFINFIKNNNEWHYVSVNESSAKGFFVIFGTTVATVIVGCHIFARL